MKCGQTTIMAMVYYVRNYCVKGPIYKSSLYEVAELCWQQEPPI